MGTGQGRRLKIFLVFAIAFNQLVAGLAHAGLLEGHNHLRHDHASVEQPYDHSAARATGGHEPHQATRQEAGNTLGADIPAGLPNNGQHYEDSCCAVGFSPCGVVLPIQLGIPEPTELMLASVFWQADCPKSWRNAPLLRPPILLS